jgi:hypothetical protein
MGYHKATQNTKSGNQSSNSPICITRFCANASVPHHKNVDHDKKRSISVKVNMSKYTGCQL